MGISKGNLPEEFLKAIVGHCNHITTLSSGFILVMVTFLEKLFSRPDWKWLVVVSFIFFAISIILSVLSQAFVIDYLYPVNEIDTSQKAKQTSIVLILMWTSFIIGTISLMIFGVKNFL